MVTEPLRTLFGEPELVQLAEGAWQARLTLHKDHPLYAGHFPGRPVTPGVAQIQLIEQLVSRIMGERMMLCGSKAIKFLRPIDPYQNADLIIVLRLAHLDGVASCDASAEVDGHKVFSMKAEFQPLK
ncbi:MAG: hypothetical protein KDB88_01320 [Flavobacteriales bacterium]|nr:hypothetical protein [Flavobacteriales bacterium]